MVSRYGRGCICMGRRVPVALVPLLVVELLVVVVRRMDGEMLSHPGGKLQLLVDLVQQQIVLLTHHTVTVRAVFRKDLETYVNFRKKRGTSPEGRNQRTIPLRTLPES
jgi:hypothetical protein